MLPIPLHIVHFSHSRCRFCCTTYRRQSWAVCGWLVWRDREEQMQTVTNGSCFFFDVIFHYHRSFSLCVSFSIYLRSSSTSCCFSFFAVCNNYEMEKLDERTLWTTKALHTALTETKLLMKLMCTHLDNSLCTICGSWRFKFIFLVGPKQRTRWKSRDTQSTDASNKLKKVCSEKIRNHVRKKSFVLWTEHAIAVTLKCLGIRVVISFSLSFTSGGRLNGKVCRC